MSRELHLNIKSKLKLRLCNMWEKDSFTMNFPLNFYLVLKPNKKEIAFEILWFKIVLSKIYQS